ncbi:MAG TPA: hypothetical protein VIP77_18355 [Jiangellaceae bacterium]
MTMTQAERREAVLREAALRTRRRAAGRAGRRAAVLRTAVALRMAASTVPRDEHS